MPRVAEDKHVAFPETRRELRLDQKFAAWAWSCLAAAIVWGVVFTLLSIWSDTPENAGKLLATGFVISVPLVVIAAVLACMASDKNPKRR